MSYWDKFYKKAHTLEPSNFARLFSGFLRKEEEAVIELGCGNGRDAKFLHNFAKKYTALDFSNVAVQVVNSYGLRNVEAIVASMSDVELSEYTAIYSRFSLHSINEKQEKDLFLNLSRCQKGCLLAIEARSDLGAFDGDHYRRFINNDSLSDSLKSLGFETLLHTHGTGLSVYGEEDPPVIWYVGIKK